MASEAAEHPCEVMRQCTHGLHSFGIQRDLTWFATVGNIPVLGSSHRHIHHLEWHLESLHGSCGTSAAADSKGCRRLVLDVRTIAEESTLHDGQECAVRLAVINRRGKDKTVRLVEFAGDMIAYIIIENTSAVAVRLAAGTGDTTADGLVANPDNFRFDALGMKRLRDFCKRSKSVEDPT